MITQSFLDSQLLHVNEFLIGYKALIIVNMLTFILLLKVVSKYFAASVPDELYIFSLFSFLQLHIIHHAKKKISKLSKTSV